MYGERGRIGLITLATDASVLPEYQRAMPPGVAVYPAPIVLPRGEATPAALSEMLAGDALERAAELLAWVRVAPDNPANLLAFDHIYGCHRGRRCAA